MRMLFIVLVSVAAVFAEPTGEAGRFQLVPGAMTWMYSKQGTSTSQEIRGVYLVDTKTGMVWWRSSYVTDKGSNDSWVLIPNADLSHGVTVQK